MKDNGKIVFKGNRNGLYIKMSRRERFTSLLGELERKLSASGGFFRGSEAVVDVGDRVLTTEQILQLENLLQEKGGFELTDILHQQQTSKTPASKEENALLVRRTLHSGQHIRHDGNLVIMGDLNPGAEAVASGDIMVMGRLRGVVHAGAVGNESAAVVAFRFTPIQLRIAEMISRSPAGDENMREVPEIARLKDGVIVVEEYLSRPDTRDSLVSGDW